MSISAYDNHEDKRIFEIFRGGKYDLHLWVLYNDLEKALSVLTSIQKSKCIKIPVVNSFFADSKPVERLVLQKVDSELSSASYSNDQLEINFGNEVLENLIHNFRGAVKSGEVFPSEVTELLTVFGYDITLYASVGY